MFLDDDDVPIIIDFDSCGKEGEDYGMEGATYQWTEVKYDFERSVSENDFSGLRRIHQYPEDPKFFRST